MKKLAYLLVGVLFILTSCNKNEKKMINMIPSDVSFATSIDTKSLAQKSGISISDGKLDLGKEYEGLVKGLSPEEKAIFENLPESGIDLMSKMFAFANDTFSGVLLAKVSDTDKLKTFLEKTCNLKIEDSDGFSHAIGARKLFIFNDDILLMGNMSYRQDPKEYLNAIQKLYSLEEEKSLLENSTATDVLLASNDVSVFINSNFFENLSSLGFEYAQFFKGIKFEGASINLNFNDSDITLKAEIIGAENNKEFKQYADVLINQDDKCLKFIPSNADFAVATSINGKKMAKSAEEALTQIAKISGMDMNQIKSTLDLIDGPIAVGYTEPTYAATRTKEDMHIAIKSTDSKALATNLDAIIINNFPFVSKEGNTYTMGSNALTMDIEKDYVYLHSGVNTGANSLYENAIVRKNFDTPVTFYFNANKLKQISDESKNIKTDFYPFIKVTKDHKTEMILKMENQTKDNSLQEIIYLSSILSSK